MKRVVVGVMAALAAMVVGCGGDLTPSAEPANHSEFDLVNSSSLNLLVRVQPGGGETAVGVGASTRLFVAAGTCTEFVAPSEAITCISVFASSAGQLVYQQSPVSDDVWSESRGAVRVMSFTLELSDADLSSVELTDNCSR